MLSPDLQSLHVRFLDPHQPSPNHYRLPEVFHKPSIASRTSSKIAWNSYRPFWTPLQVALFFPSHGHNPHPLHRFLFCTSISHSHYPTYVSPILHSLSRQLSSKLSATILNQLPSPPSTPPPLWLPRTPLMLLSFSLFFFLLSLSFSFSFYLYLFLCLSFSHLVDLTCRGSRKGSDSLTWLTYFFYVLRLI